LVCLYCGIGNWSAVPADPRAVAQNPPSPDGSVTVNAVGTIYDSAGLSWKLEWGGINGFQLCVVVCGCGHSQVALILSTKIKFSAERRWQLVCSTGGIGNWSAVPADPRAVAQNPHLQMVCH